MAQIAMSLGCSKATLYAYFESKEVLFYEVLMTAAGSQMRTCHCQFMTLFRSWGNKLFLCFTQKRLWLSAGYFCPQLAAKQDWAKLAMKPDQHNF